MTVTQSLLAFSLAAALLAATPGVDTALVLRTAIAGDARRAAGAALGIAAGCLLWGGAVALGLAALITTSAVLFDALRWIGALYLGWLGIRLLLAPRRAQAEPGGAGDGTPGAAFAAGFLTNLLNPKVGIFYLTLLPQFVPAGVAVASFIFVLAAIHVLMSLLWFALLIALARRVAPVLRRPAVIASLDRLTGLVFVGFGVRLAVAQPG